MIEFALLFGTGFLSATLIALLVAPAIHRRIVRYTENRIKATMPISPQEVRAQRDMARAVYAAENARTKQELVNERDRSTGFQIRVETLTEDLRRLEGTNAELRMRIDQLDVDAAETRARLREGESYIEELKAALQKAEDAETEAATQLDDLRQQLVRSTSDADGFRIDISARDTEMENLRLRLNGLRDERKSLRNELQQQTARTRDAEARLAQEEERVRRLEEKLTREIANRSDKEDALERRVLEISRLRERLRQGRQDAGAPEPEGDAEGSMRSGAIVLQKEEVAPQMEEPVSSRADAIAEEARETALADPLVMEEKIAHLAEDARNRATALSERLLNSKSTANDEALRQELASIAANMVAITAAAEGPSSSIRTILSGRTGGGPRESLAARAKKTLAGIGGTSA